MLVTIKKLYLIISSLSHFWLFNFTLLKKKISNDKEYLTFEHALILKQNVLNPLMYAQNSTQIKLYFRNSQNSFPNIKTHSGLTRKE